MIEIALKEGDPWSAPRRLTGAQLTELNAAEAVQTRPAGNGMWQLRTRRQAPLVGAVRLGRGESEVQLRIAPKISIARLLFLVEYAQQPKSATWQDAEVAAREAADLVPALAHAFGRAADRALRQGALLGYREINDAATVVRGKLRVGDQLTRHYTFQLPAELRYDDYTADIPENRLLLTAAQRLLRLPGIRDDTRSMLRRILVRLVGVSPLQPSEPPPTWQATRLNARYHTALGLADLVLRGNSYELDAGRKVRVDGLLLSMWQLFQDFVTVAIARALRKYGGECRFQDPHHLDHSRLIQLDPDLVYYRQSATSGNPVSPVAVTDAKYTVTRGPKGHPDHLYQVVTYCTVLGVRRGFLVYAQGPEAGHRTLRIRGSDIEIVQYPLDLTQPPSNLLHQIQVLADEIAGP
jgi:5-methylcytosine-specific restriction enzyme subunit McrC